MTSFNAAETKRHFSKLLDRVAQGERITIVRYGDPVALLVPPAEEIRTFAHGNCGRNARVEETGQTRENDRSRDDRLGTSTFMKPSTR